MQRGLRLMMLAGVLAMGASGAHAASAAVFCETAPGVRHLERVSGYRTHAEAEAAVRERCRPSTLLTLFARPASARDARAQAAPVQAPLAQEPVQERACRRYPNLC